MCQEELGKTTERLLVAKRISLNEAKQAYNEVLTDIFALPPGIHAIFRNKIVDLNDPDTIQQLPSAIINIHGILTHLADLSDSVQYRRENKVRYLFENETLRHATLELIGILNDSRVAEKLQTIQNKRIFGGKTLADYGREIRNLTRQLENTINRQRRTDIATDEPETEELISRVAGQAQVRWMKIIRGALRSRHLVEE
jgi:hypothetical protein